MALTPFLELYKKFAKYYDDIYSFKKYDLEVEFLESVFKKYNIHGKDVLDVACGTGNHDRRLVKHGYAVTGVDLNKEMLKIARKKVPQATYKQGNMQDFNLKKKFDAVLCMFTAMNYNLTLDDVVKTLMNFKRHLKDGGVLVFDCPPPRPHRVSGHIFSDEAAVLYERKEHGELSEMILYWMFGKKENAEVIKDSHLMHYYSEKELRSAVRKAGLKCDIYYDFSIKKKKGKRLIFVCTN